MTMQVGQWSCIEVAVVIGFRLDAYHALYLRVVGLILPPNKGGLLHFMWNMEWNMEWNDIISFPKAVFYMVNCHFAAPKKGVVNPTEGLQS